ncbi:MAG TPA: diacylglycerol kinase family protein [Candidatus Eisenbacteria bacterium]|nr:diacylglycerol kinase family protein [Candidatus Eisenbacteria bacterium]
MLEKKAHWFFNIFLFSISFRHAARGLWWGLKYNQNLRFHFAAAIAVIFVSILFHINAFEMGILGVMILIVICTEMINTVVEEMVDLITTEHRQQAKIAKDVAAGMVLISAAGSVIVGFLVFAPHIIHFFIPSWP